MADYFKTSNPLCTTSEYEALYQYSLQNSERFWLEQANRIDWIQIPTVADQSNFGNQAQVQWFKDGVLNVCYNCVDRHLPHHADKTAIIFEPDEPGNAQHITYKALHENVCRCANILKFLGVKKGDIVTIYLPMIPELIYMMLACIRIGAIHSVVFSGFSANALSTRLIQSQSELIITTEVSHRGGKTTYLKQNVDTALTLAPSNIKNILLIDPDPAAQASPRSNPILGIQTFSYHQLLNAASPTCAYESMAATDPLFVLYTSGSTGKPKGILHSSGGYIVYASLTHQLIFDLQPDDIYFCTADIGWITGHSYGVYGPLSNAATLVLFQGTPTYPNPARLWNIIDQHRVSLFYTAPTALRTLSRLDEGAVDRASLQSLRILASVGEPIDPTTWQWYYEKVGRKRCPIMDTWWQTESGGVLVCPLLQSGLQKPSCAAKPFFGIHPALLNENGKIQDPGIKGHLCIAKSWPGQTIGILEDSAYFQTAYFSMYPQYYTSGDSAKMDSDGDIWILGRMDDVLNVSGHRINSAELEQAVMSHEMIADACVVGFPHDIKGQGIFIFAVPHSNMSITSEVLTTEIRNHVRKIIGPIATPDYILLVHDLPKTRSGKIVRRLLRKIASNDSIAHEDVTTIANHECLEEIQQLYHKSIESVSKKNHL